VRTVAACVSIVAALLDALQHFKVLG